MHTWVCAYQGVRNVSFSQNFAYVLNEWSLSGYCVKVNLLSVLILADEEDCKKEENDQESFEEKPTPKVNEENEDAAL